MKIIQIVPKFVLAGAEIMCENLTYALCANGHKVVVVSLYDERSAITDRMEQAGIDIRYLDKKPGLDLSMIFKLRRIFKNEKADIVHTHLYVTRYAIPAAILSGVRGRVHTVHNVARKECGRLGRILNRFFFRINHVRPVALSKLIQDTVVQEYKIGRENIPVIFNGMDLSKYTPKTSYSVNGVFKILHIGRFSAQKNHRGLLQTFCQFHQKYPNSVLYLIGEGDKQKEIEQFVANNGLNDCVQFLGLQENVSPFLYEADLFALPSLYEGVPMTLIEAMATGMPIVATKVGGVPDMLIHEESALLTSLDTKELVCAFSRLYADESLRTKLGKNAQRQATVFSAQEMARGYNQVYDACCK